MEISFKSDGAVQIVEVAKAVGPTEGAAIRFKLEEKINGGKQRVILDLARLDIEDDAVRATLAGIITYLLTRQVLVVVSGLRRELWPLLILPDGRQVKNFLTRAEALSFAQAAPLPDPRAHLKTLIPTNDEEAKGQDLAKLLEKYEVFQHGPDLDPFRLEFLAAQYKNAPNREALGIENKVREAIAQVSKENDALNQEIAACAAQLKQLMLYRKSPLGPKEFALKEKSLLDELALGSKERDRVSHEIAELTAQIKTVQKEAEDNLAAFDKEIAGLEQSLKNARDRFALEEKNLKTQDAQEQLDFEAKINERAKRPT